MSQFSEDINKKWSRKTHITIFILVTATTNAICQIYYYHKYHSGIVNSVKDVILKVDIMSKEQELHNNAAEQTLDAVLYDQNELYNRTTETTARINILEEVIDKDNMYEARMNTITSAIISTLPKKHYLSYCSKPTPAEIREIASSIISISDRYSVDAALALAIIRQESNFCQKAISPAGAIGIMQIMPSTAKQQVNEIALEANYRPNIEKIKDNIWIGVYYISKRLIDFNYNESLALMAYNAGINHVLKVLAEERKDFYEEPKRYAELVLEYKNEYKSLGVR